MSCVLAVCCAMVAADESSDSSGLRQPSRLARPVSEPNTFPLDESLLLDPVMPRLPEPEPPNPVQPAGHSSSKSKKSRVIAPTPPLLLDEPDSFIELPDASGCCVGSRGRFWIRGEVLAWWIDGFSVPALVTTSETGTARADAGVLTRPTTSVLFGNSSVNDDLRIVGRLTVGGWFDAARRSGVEAVLFGVESGGTQYSATSGGEPILARPFFNVEAGFVGQDAELTAFPGELSGTISVDSQTKLHGLELLYRRGFSQEWPRRVDLVAGWRYAQLEDDLRINDNKEVLSGALGLAVGTTLSEFDRFRTKNTFHGGEVGVVVERWWCGWAVEGVLKVALGNTHMEALVDGSTTVTVPVPGTNPSVTQTDAGLLAQQTNIGVRERNEFAVIPELGINLGYDVTPNLRATLGYSFIYWSRVARPGDQIDTNLNLTQLPPGTLNGIPSPGFDWHVTDVWVQGINAGIDYRF